MARHKVVAGREYIFYAVFMDREHRDMNGRVGRVVNLHGCPKANTMGHAYFQVEGERFRLVNTNSLYAFADRQLVIDALKLDAIKNGALGISNGEVL